MPLFTNTLLPEYKSGQTLESYAGEVKRAFTELLNKLNQVSDASSLPAWNVSTTYSSGSIVIFNTKLYSSSQNNNVGRQPDKNPSYWGAINNTTPISGWAAYTPTITSYGGTNPTLNASAVIKGLWRRVSSNVEVIFSFYQPAGGTAGTGSYYLVSLPSGLTLDFSGTPGLGNAWTGTSFVQNIGSVPNIYGQVYLDSTISSTNFMLDITSYSSTTLSYSTTPIGPSYFHLGQQERYYAYFSFPVTQWTSNYP